MPKTKKRGTNKLSVNALILTSGTSPDILPAKNPA